MFASDDGPPLTTDQQAAVNHPGGHLLVVAGAGTGKTTMLAARVARLVERGTAPDRICLMTFSRRAASELLARAERRCGHDIAARAVGGTFHSVANRLLRRHGARIGLDPGFTLLDQGDTAELLGLVRAELLAHDGGDERAHRRAKKDTMAQILSRVVNTGRPLPEVLSRHYPWCAAEAEELGATFGAYVARKRRTGVLDYDDLLRCLLALLRSDDTGVVTGRFDHVLVDEYQDTNALQANIVAAFAAGGATITAVGDDLQAIYGFRAAEGRHILEFPERFSADVLPLETNHRSTPEILATANAVAEGAPTRHDKTLRATRASGPQPVLVACDDEEAQSAAVAGHIAAEHARGRSLRRQAVLVRTGHHSDCLELELTARRIPYRKFGGMRFLEAAHVKDLTCLLRVTENPQDELAWFRILQLLDGVGPATARRLAAGAPPCTGDLPPSSRMQGADLLALVEQVRSLPAGSALERAGEWLAPVHRRRYPDAAARANDLAALARAAGPAPSLTAFLADLVLDPPASTGDLAGDPSLDDDWLTISTIHSAKGAEWEIVHLLHLTDGNLPSDLATGRDEEIDEERRLLYVALTRARDELRCYQPLRYHTGIGRFTGADRHSYAQPSRFLTPGVTATFAHLQHGRPVGTESAGDREGRALGASVLAALDDDLLGLFGVA